MAATYVHLSGKQINEAILKIHGIIKEDYTIPQLTSTACSRSSLKMEKFSYFSVFGLNLESWAHLISVPSSFFFSEIDTDIPGRRIRSPTYLILYSLKFDI